MTITDRPATTTETAAPAAPQRLVIGQRSSFYCPQCQK